jgi:hypothetical protein
MYICTLASALDHPGLCHWQHSDAASNVCRTALTVAITQFNDTQLQTALLQGSNRCTTAYGTMKATDYFQTC